MGKKTKMRSFGKRLTRWIAITQFIVMGIASYWIFMFAKSFILIEEASLHKSSLSTTNANVRWMLSQVSTSTRNRVNEIEGSLAQPDRLVGIMSELVSQNPMVRSCGISFVADYYPQKGHWFCPYAVRGDDDKIEERIIGSASHDYLEADWFLEALKADSCYWSKPFFDSSDSITPLVSYMVPIHNKQGKTVAILGADLPLNWISEKMFGVHYSDSDSIEIRLVGNKEASDGSLVNIDWRGITKKFIIDKSGAFVAHPNKGFIIKQNYFELAKTTSDTIDDYIGHQMVAGKMGSYTNEKGIMIKSFSCFDSDLFPVYMFYEPIEDTGWSMASVVPNIMVDAIAIGMGVGMIVLIAIALLVTRIVGRIIIKRATKPMTQLATSANEVAKGNFEAPLPDIKHNDEIRLLRDSFEGMQHSLTRYVSELKETTASKAAFEKELKVAHDIQMSMLPKIFPPYPERSDIDIYGMLTPAKEVGGDLFDFYIRDERLFFCIGDVSGKGVPASLVMATTHSLFRSVSSHLSDPQQIAETLNKILADGNETSMFVTAFIGVLDLATGCLHYCNAGHNPPLTMGREVRLLDCEPNVVLGLMDGLTFQPQEIFLDPETTIFLFTDGLNEAEDATHAQFGDDRIFSQLEDLLAEGNNQPETIVSRMSDAVHRFVDGAEQSDDLTMLAIKYNGGDKETRRQGDGETGRQGERRER